MSVSITVLQRSELNSFLWSVKSKTGVDSYFFGTIHVPYTQVWDYIPQNAKDAFKYAERVYFELDMTDRTTAEALAECQMLPDDQDVSSVLPRRLYRKLWRHMENIREKIPEWISSEQKHKAADLNYYSEYQYR